MAVRPQCCPCGSPIYTKRGTSPERLFTHANCTRTVRVGYCSSLRHSLTRSTNTRTRKCLPSESSPAYALSSHRPLAQLTDSDSESEHFANMPANPMGASQFYQKKPAHNGPSNPPKKPAHNGSSNPPKKPAHNGPSNPPKKAAHNGPSNAPLSVRNLNVPVSSGKRGKGRKRGLAFAIANLLSADLGPPSGARTQTGTHKQAHPGSSRTGNLASAKEKINAKKRPSQRGECCSVLCPLLLPFLSRVDGY